MPRRLPLTGIRRAPGRDRARPTERRQELLSRTAEYALRALSSLAAAGGGPLTAQQLSPATSIPSHYLSKVLRQLATAGLLHSQRGHGGGFTLSRPPERIHFVEVLEAVGSYPTLNRCAFGWGRCNARYPCPLHPAWFRLNEAFVAWACTTTLADVSRAPVPAEAGASVRRRRAGRSEQ